MPLETAEREINKKPFPFLIFFCMIKKLSIDFYYRNRVIDRDFFLNVNKFDFNEYLTSEQ